MNYLESLIQQPLKYTENNEVIEKNIDDLIQNIKDGPSQDENFLYFRSGERIKIFDRVCDHNGGKLSVKGMSARCPLHGWELDLESGSYANVHCEKKPLLDININKSNPSIISIEKSSKRLCSDDFDEIKKTEIRFINHASLIFKLDGISFATDPWIIGSAFCNGWWLTKNSPHDAFVEINKCDFIYISHNHPDHLHKDSLKHIRKDMPILTANFLSGSTKKLINESGFSDIVAMDFVTKLTDFSNQLSFSVLKSGDFRDDSGLYIQHGRFKCLLTVDSHFLNFGKLPKVDLLASSFAGGSTGFPICFENYTEQEKTPIITRNRKAYKVINSSNIRETQARYFLPYAGFFMEKAKRDNYVKKLNKKNSIEEFEETCEINKCSLLNLDKYQKFVFNGSQLESQTVDKAKKNPSYDVDEYISKSISKYKDNLSDNVLSYFRGCNFKDSLTVDLIATNDNFSTYYDRFLLNFKTNVYNRISLDSDNTQIENDVLSSNCRYLQIKVRASELFVVLKEGKPWEDLAIGFQCRIYRQPNIYNSEFWFYFTNIYIGNAAATG
mgnify:CR=1 FL=1